MFISTSVPVVAPVALADFDLKLKLKCSKNRVASRAYFTVAECGTESIPRSTWYIPFRRKI